jgi:hypothetical protein
LSVEPSVIKFKPGDARLTRLVKKLAEQRGFTVDVKQRWNGYGYEIYEYTVDGSIYGEAFATIESKRAAEMAKEKARRNREEEARRLAWEEDLARRCPRLKEPLPYGTVVYTSAKEIPIDKLTQTDWRRLGCRVTAEQARSYVVTGGGVRVVALFSPWDVTETRSPRSNWTAERLWQEYQSRRLNVAHAVFAANRLVKVFPENRRSFYPIKDQFLRIKQDHLVEGRFVRTETRQCWSCDGDDDWCDRCGGTGIFAERDLYEHLVEFDGVTYSFHSYVRPSRLGETRGADLPRYGRRLKPTDKIPYRIGEYLKMLGYVARLWG